MMKRYLVLANGSVYPGEAFGSDKPAGGELVFTTGMSGYQEAITDASYHDQILTFTYPLIGNYGVNPDDYESKHAQPAAIIVHELARRPSNWRATMSLGEWAQQQDLPGISGVDTRALTKEIRDAGVMQALITDDVTPAVNAAAQNAQYGQQQVAAVTSAKTFSSDPAELRVGVLDFGEKNSILRELHQRSMQTVVFPANTTAAAIAAANVDAIMLSNGPGNPAELTDVLPVIRTLQDQYPLMAICLGHQLFALANGAQTYKLKFGHRGFNHAVRELSSGRIGFTSQNHGFAVAADSLTGTGLTVTHQEINDNTIEGLQLAGHQAFSVQFHPDAAPGPHDYVDLFDQFKTMILNRKEAAANA
ncbi:carbamoyl phosphate synthase small subunit [Lacticaseibacillus pabuli]|uniref:Carbamoyl phosphate synthase small chain n=1 Tax=Lacticaseibacillus pabuli TaxID=3025672 RepID=A0ABY7WUK1_9LACO|nr:carbamoyl phosphate synthase small subunit [Lacticaseibacillus sp. KACC 23028]WDF83837.1 carbamoyl phosphate synthase small subunit [Lacticaseibacillus sp. KACC 23028]